MGVDPYLLWVCGLNDAESYDDPRFDKTTRENLVSRSDEWYGDAIISPLWDDDFDLTTGLYKGNYSREKAHRLADIFHEGSPMTKLTEYDPIAGYIIAESHDGNLLRALSIIPGFCDIFKGQEGGHVVLPQLDPEEHSHRYRHQTHRSIYGKKMTDDAIREGRWINMYDPWYTDVWFKIALHVLHFSGWVGTTREMLKLIVTFGWS